MEKDDSQREPVAEVPRNLFYLGFAYTCVGLAFIGVFLPLMPTTPFLLLAVWAAAKGSPALHRWLYEHPRFGAVLIAWEQKRAVSTGAKWTACIFMTLSWLMMLHMTTGWMIPAITGVFFLAGAAFLVTRPSP
ncbi:MAG: YbaN family protein [Pseudomonadales bacterium]